MARLPGLYIKNINKTNIDASINVSSTRAFLTLVVWTQTVSMCKHHAAGHSHLKWRLYGIPSA